MIGMGWDRDKQHTSGNFLSAGNHNNSLLLPARILIGVCVVKEPKKWSLTFTCRISPHLSSRRLLLCFYKADIRLDSTTTGTPYRLLIHWVFLVSQ